MARHRLLVVLILIPGIVLAQSQFAGKWQTRVSQVTGKHSITVDVSVNGGSGTVVLVNPDRSEIQSPILNPELRGKVLEFESKVGDDTFYWRLILEGKRKGLLRKHERNAGRRTRR